MCKWKTERKVSCYMRPHIETIFARDNIAHEFISSENGFICKTDLSKTEFTEVLEDAFCEIQRSESKSNIPVYSLRTIQNKEKLNRLMRMNKRNGFHILNRDMSRCQDSILAEGIVA